MTKEPHDVYLELQEQAANMVAALTGLKRQFMDNGWSQQGAEEMTALMVRTSLSNQDTSR